MGLTTTVVEMPGLGQFTKLKLVVLNIACGANETTATVDYATYGLNAVLIAGHMNQDAYTTGSQLDSWTVGGTSVVHTWTATDLLNARVWAIGY